MRRSRTNKDNSLLEHCRRQQLYFSVVVKNKKRKGEETHEVGNDEGGGGLGGREEARLLQPETRCPLGYRVCYRDLQP